MHFKRTTYHILINFKCPLIKCKGCPKKVQTPILILTMVNKTGFDILIIETNALLGKR